MLGRLRKAGVEPVAFTDDTPEKQGQSIDGLTVMSPRIAFEQFGARLVFVVTILNPLVNFMTARRRLQELGAVRVISFLHLAWRYPETCLPYRQFESPPNSAGESGRYSPRLASLRGRRIAPAVRRPPALSVCTSTTRRCHPAHRIIIFRPACSPRCRPTRCSSTAGLMMATPSALFSRTKAEGSNPSSLSSRIRKAMSGCGAMSALSDRKRSNVSNSFRPLWASNEPGYASTRRVT